MLCNVIVMSCPYFFKLPKYRYFIKRSVVSSTPIHSSCKTYAKDYSVGEMKTVCTLTIFK